MRMRNKSSPPPLLLLLLLLLLSAEQRWGVKYDIADAPPRLLRLPALLQKGPPYLSPSKGQGWQQRPSVYFPPSNLQKLTFPPTTNIPYQPSNHPFNSLLIILCSPPLTYQRALPTIPSLSQILMERRQRPCDRCSAGNDLSE
jgi:hypothetical protein